MKKQVKRKVLPNEKLLPLFAVTVGFVFAVLFTVVLVPALSSDIDSIPLFIILLIVATTVSSTVGIVFYLILKREI